MSDARDELARRRAMKGAAASMVGGASEPDTSWSPLTPDEVAVGEDGIARAREQLAERQPVAPRDVPAPRPTGCTHPNQFVPKDGSLPEGVPWCPDCETPLDVDETT